MTLEENKYDHLVELGGSDYEIVDGEPNIKGWDVKNELGQQIGEVDELLFNPDSRKVRYLVVDLDGNELGIEDDKKILVPIGIADLYDDGLIQDTDNRIAEENEISDQVDRRLEDDPAIAPQGYAGEGTYNPDDDGKVVVIPVNAQQIMLLPRYVKDRVDPETELSVRRIFEGRDEAGLPIVVTDYNRDEFYTHSHFDEDRFYRRRRPSSIEDIEENRDDMTNDPSTFDTGRSSRIVERRKRENDSLDPDRDDLL